MAEIDPGLKVRLQLAVVQELLPPGPPHTCSYLPDQIARTQAFSVRRLPAGAYQTLMDLNFRRSGVMLYRPACERCQQCQQIRVPVQAFRPDRSQRRCWSRNQDLEVHVAQLDPTEEKHALFDRYLIARHDGKMDRSWGDFCEFLYDTPVKTVEASFRLAGTLVGVGIVDVEPISLSTVYCYFDPKLRGIL